MLWVLLAISLVYCINLKRYEKKLTCQDSYVMIFVRICPQVIDVSES